MMLYVRLLGSGITESASRLDIRYRFRLTRIAFVPAFFGLVAIYHGDYLAVAIIWGCLMAILLVASFVLRLSADPTGVHIVNWGTNAKIRWTDIAKVETASTPQGTTVRFHLNNGRNIKATALWDASLGDADRIADRLRHLQHHAAKASRSR
jgi:hypothetical protein